MTRTMLLRSLMLAAAAALATTPAAAQTVDAGMTREQVVQRLGRPVGERTTGPRTYLFYRNGCEQTCGMHDLVVLEDDGVVDAIFRMRGRRYSGESSSPVAVPPRAGARTVRAARANGDEGAAPSVAPRPRRQARKTQDARTSLPAGDRPGGLVIGGGASDTAAAPAGGARRTRGVAGTGAAPGQSAGDSAAAAARPRPQDGGRVRVPILPRDTQVGVPPRERGQRTLPGPVTVPTLPRDTQLVRPDSAGRRTPAPRRPAAPGRPDSATSTSSPR